MTHSLHMILAVAAGGALGASGRYLTSGFFLRLMGTGFPWGTLVVNIAGSFLMGVIIELAALRLNLTLEWRAFLVVGVLGGYTTFSAFTLDAVNLFERGELGMSFFYVLASVVLSITALFGGLALMRAVLT